MQLVTDAGVVSAIGQYKVGDGASLVERVSSLLGAGEVTLRRGEGGFGRFHRLPVIRHAEAYQGVG